MLKKILPSPDPITEYINSGRIPWSPGYKSYRFKYFQEILSNKELMNAFREHADLPANFGVGIDERVVEYPWVLSSLNDSAKNLLDAGSVLNYPYLLNGSVLKDKKVVIMTLAPESTMEKSPNVSYIFGDLRNTLFKDNFFDEIVCISTLEHIGMDNSLLYTADEQYRESQSNSYLDAISEFYRILKPSGRLLVTVPFGLPQDFGWLLQFDSQRLDQLIQKFGSNLKSKIFYKYSSMGWNIASEEDCIKCEYFDVHSSSDQHASDLAAAARAVACLEFVKDI